MLAPAPVPATTQTTKTADAAALTQATRAEFEMVLGTWS